MHEGNISRPREALYPSEELAGIAKRTRTTLFIGVIEYLKNVRCEVTPLDEELMTLVYPEGTISQYLVRPIPILSTNCLHRVGKPVRVTFSTPYGTGLLFSCRSKIRSLYAKPLRFPNSSSEMGGP